MSHEIAERLTAALAEQDPSRFLAVLDELARAHGLPLPAGEDATVSAVTRVCTALGVRLVAVPAG